jgi:hypothetical protein
MHHIPQKPGLGAARGAAARLALRGVARVNHCTNASSPLGGQVIPEHSSCQPCLSRGGDILLVRSAQDLLPRMGQVMVSGMSLDS